MTDTVALREKIDESGMSVEAFSKKAEMLRETLYNRLNGKGEFKASEIQNITRVLNLTREERDNIFFAESVNIIHTRATESPISVV